MPETMLRNPDRLDREQPIEMTAENQGNYPNFKQNLAEKENCHLKNQQKPASDWQRPSHSSKVPKVDKKGIK